MNLSVIICTYNRADLLKECLKTLMNQSLNKTEYEVIIIDNNSTDNTKIIVHYFQKQNSGIKLFLEPKIGLSYARNRGASEASGENLLYLDDDILANENVCEKTLETFIENDWSCFGGVFTPWFYYGKPKWYPSGWGTNINDWAEYSELPKNKFATGCVFAIKKSVLNTVGGFNPKYGMKGLAIGYGEETDVQIKLRQLGYKIGFNPEININHVIPKHKLNVWWHLRAAWQNEKAGTLLNPDKSNLPFWLTLKRIVAACIKRLKYVKKLFRKDYYWQNFVFDYSEPILRKLSAIYYLYIKP